MRTVTKRTPGEVLTAIAYVVVTVCMLIEIAKQGYLFGVWLKAF